jgi:hypothetical protein
MLGYKERRHIYLPLIIERGVGRVLRRLCPKLTDLGPGS